MRRTLQILLWIAIVVLGAYAFTRLRWRLEERYPLVRFERKRLLRDVLTRSLPIRQSFEHGRYEARLDRARLELEDGLASIRMFGQVRRADPKRTIQADVELQTHIDVVEFRPDVGTIRAGLSVTGAHVIRAGRGSEKTFKPAARFFGGLKDEDWNRERLSLELPIHLDQEITIPDVSGEVSLRARRIPLRVQVVLTPRAREQMGHAAFDEGSVRAPKLMLYRAETSPSTSTMRTTSSKRVVSGAGVRRRTFGGR